MSYNPNVDQRPKTGLIVAAQPTMDRMVTIDHFTAGKPYRIPSVRRLASGKAINVARSLQIMGYPVQVVGLFGGFSGQWMADQLNHVGIQVVPIWVEGENRIAYSIYDPSGDQLTELIEDDDGPVSEENWHNLVEAVAEALPQASFMVLSGRASSGAPETGYRKFTEMARSYQVPVFLDCYGPLLAHALKGNPGVLKINSREAAEILKRTLFTLQEHVDAAHTLLTHGVRMVVITLGEEGAIAIKEDPAVKTAWMAIPPKMVGAAVGSGDVFMAGLVFGLSQNWPVETALRYATAAGTANVLLAGPGIFRMSDVNRLFEETNIQEIPGIN